jgi:hypothetical protein
MAKYDINYSCGHSARIDLYGPERDRQRKIAWFESDGHCSDCYRDKKRTEEKAVGPTFYARGTAAGVVEIICYKNSYDIKDQLKERGYLFYDEVPAPGSLATALFAERYRVPGWMLTLAAGPDLHARIAAEANWIYGHKWKLSAQSTLGATFANMIEQRSDLVGSDQL